MKFKGDLSEQMAGGRKIITPATAAGTTKTAAATTTTTTTKHNSTTTKPKTNKNTTKHNNTQLHTAEDNKQKGKHWPPAESLATCCRTKKNEGGPKKTPNPPWPLLQLDYSIDILTTVYRIDAKTDKNIFFQQ